MNAHPVQESSSDTEYETVSLGLSWGGVSIAFFLLTLASPYLMRYLPWDPPQPWTAPLLWIPVVLASSLIGLLAGGLGYWRSKHNSKAKLGLALNGLVFGLLLLATALILLILRRP